MVLEIENLDYIKIKIKSVFFFFDSMNYFNVKFPWLLKMVLGIENLDYIKKKSVFLIIKQRIYLLTKEYCTNIVHWALARSA